MSNAGRFAADMGANLARGAGQVATDKAVSMMDSAKERVAQTVGGKIASEIGANSDFGSAAGAEMASFAGSGVGGADRATPMNDEVAAFVNRQPLPDA